MNTLKDPLTGELFIPKRRNQKFKTARNRISYHNNKAANLYKAVTHIDKIIKRNYQTIRDYIKDAPSVIIDKEELLNNGFNPSYFTHINQLNGRLVRCIYDISILSTENQDRLIISKEKV